MSEDLEYFKILIEEHDQYVHLSTTVDILLESSMPKEIAFPVIELEVRGLTEKLENALKIYWERRDLKSKTVT